MSETINNAERSRAPLVKKVLALLVPHDNDEVYESVLSMLDDLWGKPERIGERFPFTWTHYYDDISPNLDRIFFSWPGLFPVSQLPEWKLATCRLESLTGEKRRANLDPGAIDGARLLLASTKGQAQRVYLRDGIFCEITVCRRNKSWEKFFYTFPDFKSGIYDEWLELVREDWKREMRALNAHKN